MILLSDVSGHHACFQSFLAAIYRLPGRVCNGRKQYRLPGAYPQNLGFRLDTEHFLQRVLQAFTRFKAAIEKQCFGLKIFAVALFLLAATRQRTPYTVCQPSLRPNRWAKCSPKDMLFVAKNPWKPIYDGYLYHGMQISSPRRRIVQSYSSSTCWHACDTHPSCSAFTCDLSHDGGWVNAFWDTFRFHQCTLHGPLYTVRKMGIASCNAMEKVKSAKKIQGLERLNNDWFQSLSRANRSQTDNCYDAKPPLYTPYVVSGLKRPSGSKSKVPNIPRKGDHRRVTNKSISNIGYHT